MIGVLASVVGLFLGLGAREGAQRSCSTRSGSPADRRAPCSQTRTVVVALVVGTLVTRPREPAAGAARDARAADRGRARGRRAAARPLRALRTPSSRRVLAGRLRLLLAYGLFGHGLPTKLTPALLGVGDRCCSSSASRCSRSAARAAARLVLGWPASTLRRRGRHARARQREAEPAADSLDRVGADDRARARDARRDARPPESRRPRSRRGQRPLRRPTTRSRRRTTSRRSRSRPRRRSRRRPGVTAVAGVRAGDGRRSSAHGSPSPASDPAAHARSSSSNGRKASQRGAGRARRTTARSSTTGYAKTHHLHVGSPLALETPTGKTLAPEGRRHLRPAEGRLAVRRR